MYTENSNLEKSIDNIYNIISNDFYNKEINIDNIINEIKNKKIIIYGAGSNGKKMYHVTKYFNLDLDCYIDKNYEIMKNIYEYKVNSKEYLKNININDYYVIVSANTYDLYTKIYDEIKKINNKISIINGGKLIFIMSYIICFYKLKNNIEHKISECISCKFLDNICGMLREFAKNSSETEFSNRDNLSKKFSSFTYSITNKCTLRCKDCSVSIPYLKEHKDIDEEIIISDITKLSNSSYFIDYIEFMGGEFLLYKNIDILLNKILKIKNIGFLSLWTTGTYIPNDNFFTILVNNKNRIHFNISDYGKNVPKKLIENQNKLLEKLDKYNIDYVVLENKSWFNVSDFTYNGKDEDFLKKYYKKCSMAKKGCVVVQNGKIYRCGPHFGGIMSNRIKEMNVLDINSVDEYKLPSMLDNFIDMEYIDACKYCVLPSDKLKIIDAAIQTEQNRTEQNRTEQNRTEQNRTEMKRL